MNLKYSCHRCVSTDLLLNQWASNTCSVLFTVWVLFQLVGDYCKLDLTCPLPGCGQQEMRVLLLEGGLKLKDNYSKVRKFR